MKMPGARLQDIRGQRDRDDLSGCEAALDPIEKSKAVCGGDRGTRKRPKQTWRTGDRDAAENAPDGSEAGRWMPIRLSFPAE